MDSIDHWHSLWCLMATQTTTTGHSTMRNSVVLASCRTWNWWSWSTTLVFFYHLYLWNPDFGRWLLRLLIVEDDHDPLRIFCHQHYHFPSALTFIITWIINIQRFKLFKDIKFKSAPINNKEQYNNQDISNIIKLLEHIIILKFWFRIIIQPQGNSSKSVIKLLEIKLKSFRCHQ